MKYSNGECPKQEEHLKSNRFLFKLSFMIGLIVLMGVVVSATQNVTLTFKSTDTVVNQGVPFSDGVVKNSSQIDVLGFTEDVRVLDSYPSGYVKWALVTFINNATTNTKIQYGSDVNNIKTTGGVTVTTSGTILTINNKKLQINISTANSMITSILSDDNNDGVYDTSYLTSGTGSGKGIYTRIKVAGTGYQQGGCNKIIIDNQSIMTKIYLECNYTNYIGLRQGLEFTIFNNSDTFLLDTTLKNGNATDIELVNGDYFGLIAFGNYNESTINLTNYTDTLGHSNALSTLIDNYYGLSLVNKTLGFYIIDQNNSQGATVTTTTSGTTNNTEIYRLRNELSIPAGLGTTYSYRISATNNNKYNRSLVNFVISPATIDLSYWINNTVDVIKENKTVNIASDSGYLSSINALIGDRMTDSGSFFGLYWKRNYPGTSYSFDGWIENSLLQSYIRTGNSSIYPYIIGEGNVLNDINFDVFLNSSNPISGLNAYHPTDEITRGHGGYQRPEGLIDAYLMTGNLRYNETLSRGKVGFNNAFSLFDNETIPFMNITNTFWFGDAITQRDGVHVKYFMEYFHFFNDTQSYANAFTMLNNVRNITNQTDGSIYYKYGFSDGVIDDSVKKEIMQNYNREGFIAYLSYNNTNYFYPQLNLISNYSINEFRRLDKGYWEYESGNDLQYPWLNMWSCYTLLRSSEFTDYRTDDIKSICKDAVSYWIAEQKSDGRFYNANETGNNVIYADYQSIDMAPYVIDKLNYSYLNKFIVSNRTFNGSISDTDISYNKYDNYYFTINRNDVSSQSASLTITSTTSDEVYDLIKHRLIEENTDGVISVSIPSFESRVYTVQPLSLANLTNSTNADIYNTTGVILDDDVTISLIKLEESYGLGEIYNVDGDKTGNIGMWFSSSTTTSKHIASNLTSTINATVIIDVTDCDLVNDITYTSNSGYTYKPAYTCSNNVATITDLHNIEPASSSNELDIDYYRGTCYVNTVISGVGQFALWFAVIIIVIAAGLVLTLLITGGDLQPLLQPLYYAVLTLIVLGITVGVGVVILTQLADAVC